MMLLSLKWLPMSQSVLGKYACGFPQLLVLMVLEPLSTSLGILVAVRGQNLSLMRHGCFKEQSNTYQTFTSVVERSLA